MYLLFFFQVFALSSSLTLGSWLMLHPEFSLITLIEAVMLSLGMGTVMAMVVGALRQGALHPAASLADNLGISARDTLYLLVKPHLAKQSLADGLALAGWKLCAQQHNRWRFRTGATGVSWGEVVTLRWELIDDESALLHLHSRPRLLIPLIGHGKHQRNFRLIYQLLAR